MTVRRGDGMINLECVCGEGVVLFSSSKNSVNKAGLAETLEK